MIPDRIIERPYYLEKIRPFIGKPLVKVFVGQRRVGKSYLMYQLQRSIRSTTPDAPIIYINKEDLSFGDIRNDIDLINYVAEKRVADVPNYLMIDEVQDITHFEKAIRHLVLMPGMDIYITGSNAGLLSGELATLLGGRYIECKVYALSFHEFLTFMELQPDEAALQKYLDWGGLPFLRNLEPETGVIMEYLRTVADSILLKDIVHRYQVRNTGFLENLVQYLASNAGNIISAKSISDYLKSQRIAMSPQIVLTYLDYLQAGLLIFKVRRKDLTGKKVFEIHEKYYFEDWGMMHAVVGFANRDIGRILENVVFIHLRIRGYEVFVGSIAAQEVDFVAEKNGVVRYFQVCYLMPSADVFAREFGVLETIPDHYPKFVISLDKQVRDNHKGIRHMHLLDFLTTSDWER